MQINLYHHPEAFKNISDAFDPQKNIVYAAQYLKKLKQRCGSWQKAIGYYHSSTPKHFSPYQQRVLSSWQKLTKTPYSFQNIMNPHSFKKIVKLNRNFTPRHITRKPDDSKDGMVQFTDFETHDFDGKRDSSDKSNKNSNDDGYLPLKFENNIRVKTRYIKLSGNINSGNHISLR